LRRLHFLTAAAFAGICAISAAVHRHRTLDAAEDEARSFREVLSGRNTVSASDQNSPESPDGVRLTFYDAKWDRVLRNIADQQHLTLIMEKSPPGRFSRRDRLKHSPESALRILNSELEPLGFRLLLQKDFLIVLDLDEARTEYARPRIRTNSQPKDQADQQTPHGNGTTPFSQTSGPADEGQSSDEWAAFPESLSSSTKADVSTKAGVQDRAENSGRQRKIVKPISHAVEGQDSPEQAASRLTADEPIQTTAIEVENTRAADLARTIYLVFEKRAELQREGINGLPSFTVRNAVPQGSTESAGEVLFRVGIDQEQNQLIIEASARRLNHLTSLVRELDQPSQNSDSKVKLVPNNGIGAKTAAELSERIHQLVAMRADEPAASSPNNAAVDASAGDQTQSSQEESDPSSALKTKPEGSLNLRGEVNVQAMQELGILILKGNEADVEKVAEIVGRLEKMSIGSLPDIHILNLQNVNSESLTELLNSVYDSLSELKQRGTTTRRTAVFVPVVQPNAILILAPQTEMDSILKLATELDQPLEPDFEFKVYALKNAIASQVLTSLNSFYEQRGGLGTRLRVIADVRTNSVVVQGRERDLTEVSQLIEKIDRDESGAVNRVQIFALKNAVAEELSATISAAIQAVTSPPQQTGGQFGGFGGTQGAQELRDNKSVALEFLVSDGTTSQLVRSGILADVRVNADSRSNSLIVSAPEASMNLLAALIRELDRAPSAVAEIKVYTLKNADAAQSVTLLETMFENQNQEEQLGMQIAGTEDASSSLIPLRFSADVRTNTVLAVGGAEALAVVDAILARLDSTDARQRTTEVIQLRNAPSDLVAVSLNEFLEQQAALQDSSEDLISNIERLRQEVIIAENTNSNSLIVSASPQYFSQIRTIIDSLDETPPEVVIQALIVEVTLDATDEFGIELGVQDPFLLTRSLAATTTGGVTTLATTGTPGLNFNNTTAPLGNNVGPGSNPGKVAAQGINNFSLGRQNTDLGFGGFVFSAQSDAVSVLLRALAARRTVHVLSRPQIRTTHNSLALVNVGQNVPLVNGVTPNTFGGGNPTIIRENTGITLEVTPRIKPDGVVVMKVNASKSALAGAGVPIFVNTDGSTIESPIINQSIAETLVNVPNGQTIVIGGMITKSDSTLERKVPWLGDLPLIGSAFRYDGTTTSRTELLIFLTPRIILTELDSELIKQVESERLHFIESEAEELHGPLYSVPPTDEEMQQFSEPIEQQMTLPPDVPQQTENDNQPANPVRQASLQSEEKQQKQDEHTTDDAEQKGTNVRKASYKETVKARPADTADTGHKKVRTATGKRAEKNRQAAAGAIP
jgi:general secretion pathway protein D